MCKRKNCIRVLKNPFGNNAYHCKYLEIMSVAFSCDNVVPIAAELFIGKLTYEKNVEGVGG